MVKKLTFLIFFIITSTNNLIAQLKKEMKNNIPNSVEIIDSHLDDFFPNDENILVFDEIESHIIHRDIYFIKADDNRPYHILLSSGMSALPMNVPEDYNEPFFAELMILLPKDWNLEYESFNDEKNYWPIRLMKEMMMLPHKNNTWLGFGHTFGFEEGDEFAEGIGFNSIMLVYSMELSDNFTNINYENKSIQVYSMIPLYKEELEFKKINGANALLEKFDEFNIEEIVKIGRKNVCK